MVLVLGDADRRHLKLAETPVVPQTVDGVVYRYLPLRPAFSMLAEILVQDLYRTTA
jgi:hypothetical protein